MTLNRFYRISTGAAMPRSGKNSNPILRAQQAQLFRSDSGGFFGNTVSMDGAAAAVRAPAANVGTNYSQGAAYIFVNTGGVWSQQAEILASDGATGDSFGWSVSISGDTVLVGAPGKTSNG